MAQNRSVRWGPVALSATLTTNILNPGTTTGGVGMPSGTGNLYYLIKKYRVVNKTAGAVTFSFWIGTTGGNAAGTEIANAQSVAANSFYESFDVLRLDVGDFLVGGASAGTSLTLFAEGEVGVAG